MLIKEVFYIPGWRRGFAAPAEVRARMLPDQIHLVIQTIPIRFQLGPELDT